MSGTCTACAAELADDARFCNHCGTATSLATHDVDDPTGEIPLPAAEAPTELITPDFEALATTQLMESFTTDELERTARITAAEEPALDARLVWGDADRPFDDTIDDTPVGGIAFDSDATTITPRLVAPDADETPARPGRRPPPPQPRTLIFRPTVMAALGIIAVVVFLVALTGDLISIATTAGPASAPVATSIGVRTGTWHVGDLASNLEVAGLLAAISLAVGAVASSMRRPWGAGLVGGSGLAIAGIAGLVVGLVEFPIRVVRSFAAVATAEPFTVTITRDLGYWAMLAAGAIGVVAFFASINDMVIDRLNDLNPIVGAVGALAALVAAVGPLIPYGNAPWSINWVISDDPNGWPTALLIGRAVQLAGLAIGGIIGFLSVRRFGLGMIAGAIAPTVWMSLSTWIGLGGSPIGPGHRNPGGSSHEVMGLTVVGAVAAATVLAVAGAIAWDRSQHASPPLS